MANDASLVVVVLQEPGCSRRRDSAAGRRRSVGGTLAQAIIFATADESFHTAFPVFDDIDDSSELFRGSPAHPGGIGVPAPAHPPRAPLDGIPALFGYPDRAAARVNCRCSADIAALLRRIFGADVATRLISSTQRRVRAWRAS